MIRRVLSVLVFAFSCASVAMAQAQWRLVDANEIATDQHLILTVAIEDAPALARLAEDIESQYGVSLTAEWPLNAIGVHCLVMDASGAGSIETLISEMSADARIRTIQRMQEFDVLGTGYQDPFFPLQHALAELNVQEAHSRSTGAGVVIGVVDSAIDSEHPDLKGRVIDARDFVSTSDASRGEGHGTAMAGVIAANADGVIGMIGVAPQSSILGLRACWQPDGAPGRCSSFSLARAVNFAIGSGVRILNMSIGGPRDPLLEELIGAAIDSGVVVVAAAGEAEAKAFPASMSGVIAAGRLELGAISAPATDVIATAPNAEYRYVSGSSVAAAHVSGVVALLLAQDGDLGPSAVATALKHASNVDQDGSMVDANAALSMIEEKQ